MRPRGSSSRRCRSFGSLAASGWLAALAIVCVGCAAEADDVHDPGYDVPTEWPLCTPASYRCESPTRSARCNATGDGYMAAVECRDNQLCDEDTGQCRTFLCFPGEVECAVTGRSLIRCADDGSHWLSPEPCLDSHYCIQDHCILGSCIGHVLLLIDRSGSMMDHWETVRESVSTLVAENPAARFGIMAFPVDEQCGVASEPQVPLTTVEVAEQVSLFFRDYGPIGGTPLLAAMAAVETGAQSIFGPDGGSLVVLSDGIDTCYQEAALLAALADVTSHLRDMRNVKTYAVGYQFQGSTAQLQVIAENGGTTATTWLPAGNEEELTEALSTVVEDWKICF